MAATFPDMKVKVEVKEEGALWHVFLDDPKANVIDAKMVASLHEVFRLAGEEQDLKAICLEGTGAHFSFGASVEEHLPDRVAGMLGALHALLRQAAASSVFVVAAVRGQCLGGGLELAAFCHRLVAAPDAKLGQPEIRLGVMAPAASVVLPQRMGRPGAEDLCLSGRVISAEDGRATGLVDEVADDPTEAALGYVRKYLLPHSASSLRHAVRAVRLAFDRRLHDDLAEVERIYLEELMATEDAKEGIQSFLEKRKPIWKNG